MKEDKLEKLRLVRKQRLEEQLEPVITRDKAYIKELKDTLRALFESGIEIKNPDFINKVNTRDELIKVQRQLLKMTEAIKQGFTVKTESQIKVSNLKDIPPPPPLPEWLDQSKAFAQITTNLQDIKKAIDTERSQNPTDYLPFRRVIKRGNRIEYDDTEWSGRSGGGSGSGGGGTTTIADGADVALGSTVDTAVTTNTSGTVSGKLRGLVTLFVNFLTRIPASLTGSGNFKVSIEEGNVTLNASDIEIGAVELKNGADDTRATVTAANALKVDGSAVTQPVSGTVGVTGVATAANQTDKSQFTKITDGTDTALVTASGEQNVLATAQPGVDIGDVTVNNTSGASAVNIQDGGNSITVDQGTASNLNMTEASAATIATNTGNSATSLGVIDDWDESDRGKVNIIVGQAGVAAGTGASSTTTQRIIAATDAPDVTALQIMDDWDESDRAKANIIVGQAGVAAGTGSRGATTQRVTIATDDEAVASLSVLDDWDESDRAKVNLIVGQAGVAAAAGAAGTTTQRVVLATDTTVPNTTGNVASAATDSGNPLKTGGKYNSTAPTFTDGQRGDTQIDSRGNTKVVEGAFEISSFFNAIENDVDISVKASQGYLKSITVVNYNAAKRYLQIHNKATAPSAGESAVLSVPVAAGSATVPGSLTLDLAFFGPGGYLCTTGIAIGVSTAAATFTAATTTDHVIAGSYV